MMNSQSTNTFVSIGTTASGRPPDPNTMPKALMPNTMKKIMLIAERMNESIRLAPTRIQNPANTGFVPAADSARPWPHCVQNRAPSAFCVPHWAQNMAGLPCRRLR